MPNLAGREIIMLAILVIVTIAWWADHRYLATALHVQKMAVIRLQERLGILPAG